MPEFKFISSNYKFVSPIRKFKANDPYYWEVDNIPLTQLEQNDLWLKDQITGIVYPHTSRETFDELRPYVTGGDNTVRVMPGNYTSRINDAFNKKGQRLGALNFTPDDESMPYFGGPGNWDTLKYAELVQTNLQKFTSSEATDALFLNGLYEKIRIHVLKDTYLGDNYDFPLTYLLSPSSLETSDQAYSYPQQLTSFWTDVLNTVTNKVFTEKFEDLGYLASQFTKRWTGIARTAIVQCPTELTIDVPAYNSEDFYYIDETGAKLTIAPTSESVRIDLIFIYSHPVDASSTAILNKTSFTNINAPKLGVLVGAGLGVDYSNSGVAGSGLVHIVDQASDDLVAADAFMLPSLGDGLETLTGLYTSNGIKVHGSIPSPEDIMNIAPELINDIEDSDVRLVGQTVMPVAYIIRRSGSTTLADNDVVDIRPLLRTTELTYDERAGIAAATPAISLANPVIGKRELEKHLLDYTNFVVTPMVGGVGGESLTAQLDAFPRVIGGGIVWGGTRWGPEGAITNGIGNSDWVQSQFPGGVSYENLPSYPDWDKSTWVDSGLYDTPTPGTARNDYINFKYVMNRPSESDASKGMLDFSDAAGNIQNGQNLSVTPPKNNYIYSEFSQSEGQPISTIDVKKLSPFVMYWVRKKINFGGLSNVVEGGTPFTDYDVKVNFLNCVSLGSIGRAGGESDSGGATSDMQRAPSQTHGVWIEKGKNYFIINVSWTGPNPWYNLRTSDIPNELNFSMLPQAAARDSTLFRCFAVTNSKLSTVPYNHSLDGATTAGGNPANTGRAVSIDNLFVDSVGACTYPTIQFEVVGYPQGWGSFYTAGLGTNHEGNTTIHFE